MSRPAIFLDRDGVIIENVDNYVRSWDDVRFLPGVFDALRGLSTSPYTVVLVTNQSAVGRGILTESVAVQINARVLAEIGARGGRIDATYMCVHSPLDNCTCRKPAPGMLLRAREEWALDLAASYMVGDAASDMAAADAAGVRGILVRTGRGAEQVALLGPRERAAFPIVDDLPAALNHILIGATHT